LPSPAKKLPLLGKAGKSVGKALIKKVPVVGPALTAYDAYNSLKK
jgi:hypothetical protein